MTPSQKNQRGSIFVMILLAIVMFSALSYAVLQGSRVGESSLTREQSKLAAQELISMADSIGAAVNKLRLTGCNETQLNFDTPQTAGIFANAGAPADGSCDIFKTTGGKVNYTSVNPDYLVNGSWGHYWFNSQFIVQDIGTANVDLVLWVVGLKSAVCQELNQMLLSQDPWPESVGTATQDFQGSFASSIADGIGDDVGSIYAGKASGCMDNGSGAGTFYRVLIAR